MTTLIIPQGVLHAGEAAPVERTLVSGHHRRHRRHPRVLLVAIWIVEGVLYMNQQIIKLIVKTNKLIEID